METLSSFFKCNSCAIQFPNSDSQRYHMKTDWHRYNLKRRIAGLTPVDAAIYADKVQQAKQYQEEVDEFGFKVTKPKEHKVKSHHDNVRGRFAVPQMKARDASPASITSELSRFSLGESVYSHAETHTDVDSNFETSSETDTIDPDYTDDNDDSESYDDSDFEEEPIQPITSCIYCGIAHRDVETNVTHMFKRHGLYIPERSYLVDIAGLICYLIEKIVIENECLCCNFQGKNLESIRAHVCSKGHCRLPYETKEERLALSKYYDFSSINEVIGKSKSKKSVGFEDQSEGKESDKDSNEDPKEDTEEEDGGINGNYTLATIDPIDSQLNLPNGTRLGHRSLQRYYRQSPNLSAPTESQLTVAQADRRILELKEKQELKEAQQLETKIKNKLVKRENKRVNFQRHFRDQMI